MFLMILGKGMYDGTRQNTDILDFLRNGLYDFDETWSDIVYRSE